MKSKYRVYGWLNGNDYDTHKSADMVVTVTAATLEGAEEIGDKRIEKKIGKCEVVLATK